MRQLKIAVVLLLAIILQSSLPAVWRPFKDYFDLPLIVVVYFALQRDALQALAIGAIAGLAADALGGGLLGAGGFSKTLTAYVIASLSTRVMLDNPLVRIPVLAGAALFDSLIYVFLQRLLDQPPLVLFAERAAFKLIGTTVLGTAILFVLDSFLSERALQRKQFAFRRRIARRNTGILRRR
ncbi:MAG: rod shape-determining protein MreD [Pyrinomonadaceae bacterium]